LDALQPGPGGWDGRVVGVLHGLGHGPQHAAVGRVQQGQKISEIDRKRRRIGQPRMRFSQRFYLRRQVLGRLDPSIDGRCDRLGILRFLDCGGERVQALNIAPEEAARLGVAVDASAGGQSQDRGKSGGGERGEGCALPRPFFRTGPARVHGGIVERAADRKQIIRGDRGRFRFPRTIVYNRAERQISQGDGAVDQMRNLPRREFLKSGGRALLGAGLGGHSRAASASPAAVYDVVIIGAGIAGLTAGFFLRDRRILLLEKEARPGGRARSGRFEGATYAKGLSFIGKPYGALKEIIETLNLDLREIPAPLHAYCSDGEITYGEEGLARLLSERGSTADFDRFRRAVLDTARDYADIPELNLTARLSGLDDVTAARWLETNKLPAVFRSVLNSAARGLFGADLDDLSALSLIPEIAFALSPDGAGAYTFDGGLAELTDALAGHLGERMRMGAKVERVVARGHSYEIAFRDPNGRAATAEAKFVVLAVPAPAALAAASDVLTEEQKDLLARIPYSASAYAALFSRDPIFDRAYDLAMTDGGFFTGVNDATRAARRFDPSVAAKKAFVLGATIAGVGYKDKAFLMLSDEAVRKKVVTGLGRVFRDAPAKVVGCEVTRFPQAYPVMAPGAFKRLIRLNEISNGRVLLAGDYMIYPSFEAAADSGDFAAEKIKELA
jgi:protoporphyrinogen oxidase